ncbi:DUF3391 domain-containing protein [Altererythrobacter sp. KTW20L]|uniref:HD-GYP domain-containing protein n=1 Tax=Altererythrobacter sp. KTW20L TaxID=2942210 RepID=UPI0020BDD0A9|nr:HD domain-containing phosphohydrolase [Altererythrobacter sp. KTW20L]MCL6250564.1 DUF3391 domain-containing protein [Altererythrobacter sp. KTW20L]
MLKRIPISDVELGMFVHKMEGSWLKHPFWKFRFMLDDPQVLQDLKSSELESVIINTAKGKDFKPTASTGELQAGDRGSLISRYREPEVKQSASRAASLKNRTPIDLQSTDPVSLQNEIGNSQVIADKAQMEVGKVFLDARLGKAINMHTIEPVVKDIFASVQRNGQAFSGLMRCKLNNAFVYRHSMAVSALMVSLAMRMKLTPNQIRDAGLAGMFLDIGTMQLPQDLTPPNGDFRNVDPQIWRRHVGLGHFALERAGGITQPVLDACLQHHERVDGTGFPQGLPGHEIAQIARMAAICDTFDYLLTDSDEGRGLDPAAAIVRLQDMDGAFDPDILRAFIECIGIYPVGSFVHLRSKRLAMVIDHKSSQMTTPVVRVFYSLVNHQRVIEHTVDLASSSVDDKIIGVADLSGLVLPEAAQLRELIFLGAHQLAK